MLRIIYILAILVFSLGCTSGGAQLSADRGTRVLGDTPNTPRTSSAVSNTQSGASTLLSSTNYQGSVLSSGNSFQGVYKSSSYQMVDSLLEVSIEGIKNK